MAKDDVRRINSGETRDITHKFDDELEHAAYTSTFIKLDIDDGIEYFVAIETKKSFEGIHENTKFWGYSDGQGGSLV
jgi:hypothetical protein